MSWYSDGERFDERDMPWCENCPYGDGGGDSAEQCKRCSDRHLEAECRAEGQRCETCEYFAWDFKDEIFYCSNSQSEWHNEELEADGWCEKWDG